MNAVVLQKPVKERIKERNKVHLMTSYYVKALK